MGLGMDHTPFSHSSSRPVGGSLPGSGRAQFGQGSASAMSMKWSALHDAAAAVGALAGMRAEPMKPAVRNFPAVMRDAGGWRLALAEEGIEDLSAIMEPGLSALLSAHARGTSPGAAALELWSEFGRARDALLALSPIKPGFGAVRRT
jgi:hypothetical protein